MEKHERSPKSTPTRLHSQIHTAPPLHSPEAENASPVPNEDPSQADLSELRARLRL